MSKLPKGVKKALEKYGKYLQKIDLAEELAIKELPQFKNIIFFS
ncbi:MAG: hypothetical protein Q6364_09370 [Candidatus Hermodarchaeota archaeon]|nr:hypothetical protein [Candidatus Hermodarchaeota archaeon]